MKKIEQLRELRALSANQLYGRITDSQKKLALFRQDKLLGKLKNTHEITEVRKSIARLQTILDEKLTENIEK